MSKSDHTCRELSLRIERKLGTRKGDTPALSTVRSNARYLAESINFLVPAGRARELAMMRLERAIMAAETAIEEEQPCDL